MVELCARRLEPIASMLDANADNGGKRPGVTRDTSNSVNQKSITAVYTPDIPPSLFCAITKHLSRFTGTSLKLPCYDVNVDGGNLECADCFEFTMDRCSLYLHCTIKSFCFVACESLPQNGSQFSYNM